MSSETKEMRSLCRELEDIQDNLNEIKIEGALIDKEIECTEEMLQNEIARNIRTKQRLDEMTKIAEEEKEKADRLFRTNLRLNGGTLQRTLTFCDGKLKEFKGTTELKRANLEKKLQDEIDAYARSHPKVQAVHENKIQLVKEERILEKLSEEFNDLISSGRSSRELSDGMFRLAVVEVATLVLRYRSLMDQLRDVKSNGDVRRNGRNRMQMLMPMRVTRLPPPVVSSEAGASGSNDQSEIASSSKRQEKLDVNEDSDAMPEKRKVVESRSQDSDRTFDRGSLLRSAMRVKKSAAGTAQKPVASTAQKPVASTVQKPAANMGQCSESENTKRSKAQKVPIPRSTITQNARIQSEKNEEEVCERRKRAFPTAGSMKATAGSMKASEDESQHSKKPKVTFQDIDSSGSDLELSQDEGVSSSDFHVMTSANVMSNDILPDHATQNLSEDDEVSPDNGNQNQFEDDNEMDQNPEYDFDDNGVDLGDGGYSPGPIFDFEGMDENDNDDAASQKSFSGIDGFDYNFGDDDGNDNGGNNNELDLFQ